MDEATHIIANEPLDKAVVDLLNVAISEVWSLGGWEAVAGYCSSAVLRSIRLHGAPEEAIVRAMGTAVYNVFPKATDEDIDRLAASIAEEAKAQRDAGARFLTMGKDRA